MDIYTIHALLMGSVVLKKPDINCVSCAKGKGESTLELLLHTKVPNLDSGICAACRNTHSIGMKVHVVHWPAGKR